MRGFPIILLTIYTKTGRVFFGFQCRVADYPDTMATNSSTLPRLPHIADSKATSYAKSTKTTSGGFGLYRKGTDIIDLTTMQSVLPAPNKKLEELIRQPAFMVTQDANGCIWLYCGNSLHRIAFHTNGDIESIHSLEIPNPYRYDITFKDVENEGKVWIGINGRLYKIGMTVQNELKETLIADCLSFAPDMYFTDFIAKENEVWIASDKGLYRYNKNENIVKQYVHVLGNPHSLSQNFLTCLAITNDKQLLVASLKGINIYNPIKDNFERISDQVSIPAANY